MLNYVVTSKKQWLTILECPNELEAMIDVAKVADVVLLMIDGNHGLEMETAEVLNILSARRMPGDIFVASARASGYDSLASSKIK